MKPDLEPDEHLRAALRHAPDAGLQAPAALGAALRARARRAVAPAPWWARAWAALGEPRMLGAAGAFATVLIGGVLVLAWRGEVPAPVAERDGPVAPVPAAPAVAPAASALPPPSSPAPPRAKAAAAPPPPQDAQPVAAPAPAAEPRVERHEAVREAPASAPEPASRSSRWARPAAVAAPLSPPAPAPGQAGRAAAAADASTTGAASLMLSAVDPWLNALSASGPIEWAAVDRPASPPSAGSPNSAIWLDVDAAAVVLCQPPQAASCRRAVLPRARFDAVRASVPERR
jgi:hypothetical protein